MGKRIGIVGAGVAGVTAAHYLCRAGHHITLIDKSRGFGGRLATRRFPDVGSADHGAQYFTISDPECFNLFTGYGDCEPWYPKGKEDLRDWFVGTPGMNAMLKRLSDGLDHRLGCQITGIRHDQTSVTLYDDQHNAYPFDTVILTPPAQQTAALIQDLDRDLADRLNSLTMIPSWTVMVAFDHWLAKDTDIWRGDHAVLGWAARNSSKPGRDKTLDSWTLQATADYSTAMLEADKSEIEAALMTAFAEVMGITLPTPTIMQSHRWRYAYAAAPLGEAYLVTANGRIVIAGDWCLGQRVGDAFASGRAAGCFLVD